MKKNVVFIVEKLSTGGAERVTAALATYLCKKDEYNIYIITYFSEENEEYYIAPEVHRIAITPGAHGRVGTILAKMRLIRNVLKEIRPDCVFSLAIPKTDVVIALATIGRTYPLIYSERNDPARFPAEKTMQIARDWVYRKSDGVVFQTKGAQEYFCKKIQDKSTVICNPLTASLPDRYEGVREHRIVNFCRIEPQKNPQMAIDAFAKISKEFPDYTLEFYGEGSLKEAMTQYAQSIGMGDRVIFHSYSPNIHQEILRAVMYVSSSNYEGISNSMLEALAIGLPTVCTDCPPGGASTTIRDGYSGLLVPVGDVDAMAAAMRRILANPAFANELSIHAAELKEELRVDRIAEQWAAFMERVIQCR